VLSEGTFCGGWVPLDHVYWGPIQWCVQIGVPRIAWSLLIRAVMRRLSGRSLDQGTWNDAEINGRIVEAVRLRGGGCIHAHQS